MGEFDRDTSPASWWPSITAIVMAVMVIAAVQGFVVMLVLAVAPHS